MFTPLKIKFRLFLNNLRCRSSCCIVDINEVNEYKYSKSSSVIETKTNINNKITTEI